LSLVCIIFSKSDTDGFDEMGTKSDDTSPYNSNDYEIYLSETTSLTAKIVNNCSWVQTLTLTTVPNGAPVLSNPNPTNGSSSESTGLSLVNVTITDPDGDGLNWTIETDPNVGDQDNSSAAEANGSKECSVSGLAFSTVYTWYVNASDGVFWTNESYSFTTVSQTNNAPSEATAATTTKQETAYSQA